MFTGQSNDVFGAHSEDFMKPVFQNGQSLLVIELNVQ